MIRTLKSSLSLGLLVAMLVTACATAQTTPAETAVQTGQTEPTAQAAKIKSAWKNFTYDGHPRKFMVLGVAKDQASRQVFEDEFVRDLKAQGVDAIASYTLLADGKQKDIVAIAEKISAQGSDAVVVARLVNKKEAQIYVPGTIFRPSIYYDTWSDYFGYSYQAMLVTNHIADDEYAYLETNVYDAMNKNMIWSATSETEMRGADQGIIKATIGAMVSSMAGQKLLGK